MSFLINAHTHEDGCPIRWTSAMIATIFPAVISFLSCYHFEKLLREVDPSKDWSFPSIININHLIHGITEIF